MTKKSQKIIFFGTEDFSAEVLKSLIKDDNYDIAAVITKPDSKRGRGKKFGEPLVKKIAKKHGIIAWQPNSLADVTDDIKVIDNRLGILVSYGKMIPKSILDLFEPIGIINIHPSTLPQYRGPSPIETATLNGDTKIGISFMKLVEEMDAGPIYKQSEITFSKNEDISEIYQAISEIASRELVELLPEIIEGKLNPEPQNDAKATYCRLFTKKDGIIDWKKPAIQIEREIRAYQIWPKSLCTIGGIEVIVKEAYKGKDLKDKEIGDIEVTNSSIAVQSKDGSIEIIRIQPIGRKEMSIREFLAGYRDKI